jgi:hypothetical protein
VELGSKMSDVMFLAETSLVEEYLVSFSRTLFETFVGQANVQRIALDVPSETCVKS